jgi:hypothetical protein
MSQLHNFAVLTEYDGPALALLQPIAVIARHLLNGRQFCWRPSLPQTMGSRCGSCALARSLGVSRLAVRSQHDPLGAKRRLSFYWVEPDLLRIDSDIGIMERRHVKLALRHAKRASFEPLCF